MNPEEVESPDCPYDSDNDVFGVSTADKSSLKNSHFPSPLRYHSASLLKQCDVALSALNYNVSLIAETALRKTCVPLRRTVSCITANRGVHELKRSHRRMGAAIGEVSVSDGSTHPTSTELLLG